MNIRKVLGYAALLLAGLFLIVATANAQTISNSSSVALNLSIAESLTVTATPSSVNFTNYSSSAGTATASAPIVVVTSGNLASGHSWVVTAGYLSSAAAALSGPSNIPSSSVSANINGGGVNPCTGSNNSTQVLPGLVAGAACPSAAALAIFGPGSGYLGSQNNPPAGAYSQTDTVVLSLSGAPNLLPGTYSGTITFVAGAF